jgi:hypothetical protein
MNCRKVIEDFDLLPINVQSNYLQMNIVLPFIVDELNTNRSNVHRA